VVANQLIAGAAPLVGYIHDWYEDVICTYLRNNGVILALLIFLCHFLSRMLQKRTFCFGVEIGFGAAVCLAVAGSASQALVGHNQRAAPRLLGAAAVCLGLWCFAAQCLQITSEWLREGSLLQHAEAAACLGLWCLAIQRQLVAFAWLHQR